ncbi:MAG TPA: protein kinase [Polyangiaceae bacterium]|nr:protein kinase [Polyangiaceae bacterium]
MPLDDAVAWNVGRYTVHGELASGGMATVHIGRMGGAGGFAKLVAIKRMHPQFAKDPDFLAMFLDEARLVTRIRHPNVVQPLDVIVEGGEVLLVMEYIHGEALSRINRVLRAKNERIPLRITTAIISAMLHGLHAAHEAKSEKGEPLGIVHRDISPQNIIVGVDGVARVLDFGIAKAADQVHLTREGELKGKLVYMAPEQLLGEPVTRRTDIFSASVVLWECLTGQRLFDSDSQSALLMRARMQKVDPPSDFAPEIPPALDAIVVRGLALDQNARYATAREMAMALEETVTPATPAQVGTWVEEVAAKALAERQERIHEIEAAGADNMASTRELVADIASDRIMTGDIVSSRSASRMKPGVPAPPASRSGPVPAMRHTPTPPPSQRLAPTPPPSARQVESTRMERRSAPALEERADTNVLSGPYAAAPPTAAASPRALPRRPDDSSSLPSFKDPFQVPSGSAASLPGSLEAPPIPTEHAKPAKTTVQKMGSSRGRYGSVIILAVLAAFLVGLLGAPSLVRKSYVDGLARRGIVATVEEVDLYAQLGTARLVGVTLTSVEVPGATAHAREILVDLDKNLDPTSVVARDVELNVNVAYPAFVSSLDRWSTAHAEGTVLGLPPTVQRMRIEGGHVVWNQPSGAGTRLEARSVAVDFSPKEGRRLGEDFVVSPSTIDLGTPLGPMGPWLFDMSRTGPSYALHLVFNETHQMNYSADMTLGPDTGKLDMRLVRASPADIAVKPDAFGAGPNDKVAIDATIHAERRAKTWAGSAAVTVDGFVLPGAHPTTLTFDGAFSAASGASAEIQRGKLGFGAGDAPLGGTITIREDGVALRLAAAPAIKCDDGVSRPALTVTVDSRDLGAASATAGAAGRLCGSRK